MITPLIIELISLKNEDNQLLTKDVKQFFTNKNYTDPNKATQRHLKKMKTEKVIKRIRVGMYKVIYKPTDHV